MLVNKAYQGITNYIRAVHPKRKPPAGALSLKNIHCSEEISEDRIIEENFLEGKESCAE